MTEKVTNFFVIGFIGIIILSIITPSCDKVDNNNYNVTVQTQVTAADGLNLNAVGDLLKKTKSTEEFERLLNDKSTGVNNLDLDEDDKVDFIKVTEYGSGNVRGYSLTTEPAAGEEQEIATIEIEKDASSQGKMEVHGNENIYGQGHYYHSRFSLGDAMLMSYLWGPRWGMWHSPYRYGMYPGYYRSYGTVSRSSYTTKTRSASSNVKRSSTSNIKSATKSPNAAKSAKSVKAPLSKPTTSQKSFQSRNPSKSVKSGGFGRSSSSSYGSRSTTSRSPSVRSSSRSGGSFGGK